MKVGLYKLNRPKYSPNGWFFIIDTSIQMGPQKCVVVLGLKKLDINKNFCPTLEDVEPLIVRPLSTSPGEVIDKILEEAATIAGVPIAVISDEGSELKKGVRLFSQKHPETIHLFDISHKVNTCLKKELNDDKVWLSFQTAAAAAIQHLKLSSIAYLIPPRQRAKERMFSSFHLIEWGLRVLRFLDSEEVNNLTQEEKSKIEWLRNYQFALPSYMSFRKMCKEALDLVREKGYYLSVTDTFLKQTEAICTDLRSIQFQQKIKKILQEEEEKVPKDAHYLGSSEVIESLFGKFKAIEGDHASSGLTSLVLSIPALVGRLDETIIAGALKTTSVRDIERWNENNMGQTFVSQRRHALNIGGEYAMDFDLDICE